MRLSRKTLRCLIKEEYDLLIEQEDLFGGEGEEDAEAAEEEDVGGEAEEEAEGAEAEGEEETEEEEVEPAIDETDPLGKSVDDELNALFVDFETEAIGDAGTESQAVDDANVEPQSENKKYSLIRILYEQEQIPPIDMETFAANVARLVKNYDSLLDMKAIIVKKAQDYIADKYSKDFGNALLDILDLRYDISLEIPVDMVAPMATGASTAAAEGGV